MKFDGTAISKAERLYDVCIVGSGPAGLTLALELRSSGLKICVLESGGTVISSELDDLKQVESHGLTIRPESRERVLGGTSQTWSGFMALLDQIDFANRPDLHLGWPIAREELYRSLDDHGHRYSVPDHDLFSYDKIHQASGQRLPDFLTLDRKVFRIQVRPIRYGKTFAYAFLPKGFDIFLNATVLQLDSEGSSAGRKVSEAVVADIDGNLHRVKAEVFVVAASAIESVRILLNSGPIGLGNEHDQVGRYFMNHPKGYVGTVVFRNPLPPGHELFQLNHGSLRGYVGLRLSESVQKHEGLLNSYIRFESMKDDRDYEKAKRLSRALRATFKGVGRGDVPEILTSALATVKSLSGLAELISRNVARLRRPADGPVAAAHMRCFAEMEPTADNRIVLSCSRDRYGMPLPQVSHRLSAHALASVERLVQQISLEFKAADFGAVEHASRPLADILNVDASHHLGGARMGNDAACSVVDPCLRVHSVENLYVAGGAVFPTGGSANPTLTIIGLSIRLADTLKARFNVATRAPAASRNGSGVLIVGAGRRVAEDVVPVVDSLSLEAFVSGIYATGRKVVFGLDSVHEVRPLSDLSQDGIRASRILYVAVPSEKLRSVLKHFQQFDCRHLTLVVDTPAIPPSAVDNLYDMFAGVVVAEDSAFLPWVKLVRENGSDFVRADFNRSGFKYHASALGRAIAKDESSSRPRIASFRGKRNHVVISYSSGMVADVKGPRNYGEGRLDFHTLAGTVISSHGIGGVTQVRPLVAGNLCTGFALGERSIALTEVESALLGQFSETDTIVSRMPDIKRVGLYRLLKHALDGQPGYTLKEGLEDISIKW